MKRQRPKVRIANPQAIKGRAFARAMARLLVAVELRKEAQA